MDKIKTLPQLGSAFRKMRIDAGLKPGKIAEHAGRSRDILHRLESGRDVSVSALLDLLRASGHAIQIVPAGLPTMEQMRTLFAEDSDDAP
ncbi:MAG: helix-turn-helix transcriptional regulator [Ramlibacter sp.]